MFGSCCGPAGAGPQPLAANHFSVPIRAAPQTEPTNTRSAHADGYPSRDRLCDDRTVQQLPSKFDVSRLGQKARRRSPSNVQYFAHSACTSWCQFGPDTSTCLLQSARLPQRVVSQRERKPGFTHRIMSTFRAEAFILFYVSETLIAGKL